MILNNRIKYLKLRIDNNSLSLDFKYLNFFLEFLIFFLVFTHLYFKVNIFVLMFLTFLIPFLQRFIQRLNIFFKGLNQLDLTGDVFLKLMYFLLQLFFFRRDLPNIVLIDGPLFLKLTNFLFKFIYFFNASLCFFRLVNGVHLNLFQELSLLHAELFGLLWVVVRIGGKSL